MYAYNCHNPDCADHGVERLFDFDAYIAEITAAAADNPDEQYDTTPHVFCGTCGVEITPDAHQVADTYQPPPPTPPANADDDPKIAADLAADRQQKMAALNAYLADLMMRSGAPAASYQDLAGPGAPTADQMLQAARDALAQAQTALAAAEAAQEAEEGGTTSGGTS